MIATFLPEDKNCSEKMSGCSGKNFNFEYAFTTNDGIKKYEPVDIKFPSSKLVPECDLKFVEEKELKTS